MTYLTWDTCLIFTVQSPLSSPLLNTLSKRDCSSKPQLNHYKKIQMIIAESFTQTSENLFPPISHTWLFSTYHGSCPASWDSGPLSLAAMFPRTGPQLYPMKFLFRVAIIYAERERTGSSLLSSFLYIHSLKACVANLLHSYKPSSWKLSNI